MSTGDPNNPYPVDVPTMQKIMVLPIVGKYMARAFSLNINYDIPWLAGYSVDGKTIYFDKDLPKVFKALGKIIAPTDFLELHERSEKALIDIIREEPATNPQRDSIIRLLKFEKPPVLKIDAPSNELYLRTHGCATAIEEYAARLRLGADGVKAYNKFMDKYVKEADDQHLDRVPPDLDLTAYQPMGRNDSKGRQLLRTMQQLMREGK